jgi:hypothetical protein
MNVNHETKIIDIWVLKFEVVSILFSLVAN